MCTWFFERFATFRTSTHQRLSDFEQVMLCLIFIIPWIRPKWWIHPFMRNHFLSMQSYVLVNLNNVKCILSEVFFGKKSVKSRGTKVEWKIWEYGSKKTKRTMCMQRKRSLNFESCLKFQPDTIWSAKHDLHWANVWIPTNSISHCSCGLLIEFIRAHNLCFIHWNMEKNTEKPSLVRNELMIRLMWFADGKSQFLWPFWCTSCATPFLCDTPTICRAGKLVYSMLLYNANNNWYNA